MLDGKEINDTAKRFLMNWKASRDARRRQRKQLHFLEGGTSSNFISGSSNALSSIPSLPPIQGMPDGGYLINPGMNPLLYDGAVPGGPHSVALPRGAKPLAAIMQARAPNSTLLNRKPTEDMSQSRYGASKLMFSRIYSLHCSKVSFPQIFRQEVINAREKWPHCLVPVWHLAYNNYS